MIRRARPGDRAELLRLNLGLFPDYHDVEPDVDGMLSGERPGAFFVADGERGLAGFIEVGTRPYAEGCESSPVAYVEAWYVDPGARRRGVGRALFAAAEQWGREQGLHEIASDALIENEISITAHKALGYQEVERIVCFRRDL